MEYYQYIPKKLEGISPVIWEQKTDTPKKWKMLPEFNIEKQTRELLPEALTFEQYLMWKGWDKKLK